VGRHRRPRKKHGGIELNSLPPDEAIGAALVMVGLFVAAWWVIEYLR
jgi:hypothetical protein